MFGRVWVRHAWKCSPNPRRSLFPRRVGQPIGEDSVAHEFSIPTRSITTSNLTTMQVDGKTVPLHMPPGHEISGLPLPAQTEVDLPEDEDENNPLLGINPIEAAREREAAIPFIKEHLGESHEEVQCAMAEAAILYQIGGDFPNCLRMMKHQLRIFLEENDPIHFEHSSMLHDLAVVHENMGEIDEAIEAMQKAYEIAIKAVERFNTKPSEDLPAESVPSHLKEVQTQDSSSEMRQDPLLTGQILVTKSAGVLARLLEREGKVNSSMDYYIDAAMNLPDSELAYTTQSPNHPHYCTLLNPLLSLYTSHYLLDEKVESLPEELQHAGHSLELVESILSPERMQQAKEEAEKSRQALRIQENFVGREHPALCHALANLAWSYLRAGEIEKTEELWNRVLAIERRTSGPYSPRSASAIAALGLTKYFQRDFREAERLIKKAIRMKEQFYGQEKWLHIGLLRYDLAHVLLNTDPPKAMEQFDLAKQIFRRALPDRMAGRRHAWYQLTLDSLTTFSLGPVGYRIPPTKDYEAPEDQQENLFNSLHEVQSR